MTSAAKGYGYRWQRYRRAFLQEHPFCIGCQRMGRITPATVVDHIQPADKHPELFWEPSNHQPLCKRCHDTWKQAQDRTGRAKGCDPHGNPVDASHPWGGVG